MPSDDPIPTEEARVPADPQPTPRCHGCGYDLTGTVKARIARCPECGAGFDLKDPSARPVDEAVITEAVPDDSESPDGPAPDPRSVVVPVVSGARRSAPLIGDEGLHCPECGYNLSGTFAAGGTRCPECGARADRRTAVPLDQAGRSTDPYVIEQWWQDRWLLAGAAVPALIILPAMRFAESSPEVVWWSIGAGAILQYVWAVRVNWPLDRSWISPAVWGMAVSGITVNIVAAAALRVGLRVAGL